MSTIVSEESKESNTNDLTCKSCGLIQSISSDEKTPFQTAVIKKTALPNGGFHKQAFCSGCGVFIKNLQHSAKNILHFGKYKDKDIHWVAENDLQYLYYLLDWDKLKISTREAIEILLEDYTCKKKN